MKKIDRIMEPTIRHGEYADDISIWVRVRKRVDGSFNMGSLRRTLDTISRWSTRYGINVSTSKSKGVIFFKDPRGWSATNMALHYRGSPIPWDKSGSALGIHIDNALGFNQHCNETIAKARRKLFLINKIVGRKWGGSTGDMHSACL